MAAAPDLKKRKIAVLGSRSVGKSSLVKQFVENVFDELYYPTIESSHSKTVQYNGKEYECLIIDTAGQDEYTPLNSQHAIGIHGYILVYSIASRNSLDMVKVIHDKITEYCGVEEVPSVIVGSKADLALSRQVTEDMGRKVAEEVKGAWVETSAKNNLNVSKVFELCIAEIEKHAGPGQGEPAGRNCVVQ